MDDVISRLKTLPLFFSLSSSSLIKMPLGFFGLVLVLALGLIVRVETVSNELVAQVRDVSLLTNATL